MRKLSMMFVALMAMVTMRANTYTKVTATPEDWSGQYLLAWDAGDSIVVFNGKDEAYGYVKVTENQGVVTGEYNAYVVEFAKMDGGYSLKQVDRGVYMGGKTTDDNGLQFVSEAILNTLTLNADDKLVTIASNEKLFAFNSTSGKSNQRFRYFKSKTASGNAYKKITLYKAETKYTPEVWVPDTIDVTKAVNYIVDSNPLKDKSHYIRGVVNGKPFILGTSWYSCWLLDEDGDQAHPLEAYNLNKDAKTQFTSLEEMQSMIGHGDTVLIYANSLSYYAKDDVYETNGGYLAKTFGKSSIVDLSESYTFAFGANYLGENAGQYKYELVLSEVSVEDDQDAIHMFISTDEKKGIVGRWNYEEGSKIDGLEGTMDGSVLISFVESKGLKNTYRIETAFSLNGKAYMLEQSYDICGLSDGEEFQLSDDVPFVPNEGDTITCAQAKEYALQALKDNETSKINVYVLGYANGTETPSGTQQTFYMDDEVNSKQTMKSFYGNLKDKEVTNGAKVLLYGQLLHYVDKSNKATAEIKNGDVYVLEGGKEISRDVKLEEIPGNAITVAEAREIASKLSTTDTSDVVIVKGYMVKSKEDYSSKFGNQSFYMEDTPEFDKSQIDMVAYRCSIAAATLVGDQIFVEGRLVKYIGTDAQGQEYTKYNLVNGTCHFVALTTDIRDIVVKMPIDKVRKVMLNGRLYIIRAGAAYSMHGNRIY